MSKKILFALILIFLAIVFAAFYFYKPATTAGKLDDFAKCLTSAGAVMYGNYNCLHCQNEKKTFGSSFQYVSYTECTREPNKCISAGITSVPTWVFSGGKKLTGEQGLEKLSQESGCSLPLK